MTDDGAAPARPHKIPESVLVVIHTDRLDVLLLERARPPGYWQSVTGSKASPDEPLAATAVREVAEETGIVVGSAAVPVERLVDWNMQIEYDIYPEWRHRYAPGVLRNVEHWFSLCVPRELAVVLHPREHTRWRWLPLAEAIDACSSPANVAALKRLPDFAGARR